MPADFLQPADFPQGAGTLAEDVEGDAPCVLTTNNGANQATRGYTNINGGAELTLATKNLNFNVISLAFAAGFAQCSFQPTFIAKARLYMGGVLMQESANLPDLAASANIILRDFKALAGAQDCILKIHNEDADSRGCFFYSGNDALSAYGAGIAIGSVKLI
jgi:hypothetical protein